MHAARDFVHAQRLLQPQIALVLGSGLGELADAIVHATFIPYEQIPGFSPTHAHGHAGQLVLGYLSGVPIVALRGRSHRYEGYSSHHVQFPIHCCHALGARALITTNAAGGLNTRFQSGDLMILDSHIDQLWPRRSTAPPVSAHPLNSTCGRPLSPYDPHWIDLAKQLARQEDIVLHQGCYLATLGPTYETRGEYRMFRSFGADAVGMSTIPEVLAAAQLQMRVLAFSVITNVASTEQPQETSHDEVVETGQAAGPALRRLISRILEDLSGQPD